MSLMGRAYICMVSLVLVPCACVFAAGFEMHVANEFSYTYNSITGEGKSQSSLTEGAHYLNMFNFYGNGKFKGFDYNFNLGTKSTDDRRYDVERFSLTDVQANITNRIHTLNLGDTFESFSQYSLNTSIKGGSYRYWNEAKNSPEVTFIYGVAYPRWSSFWGTEEVKAIKRDVYGARFKKNVLENLWLGFSAINADDKHNSRIFDSDSLYDNTVYSFDVEYKPLPALTIYNETSFSKTVQSPSETAADSKYNGKATRFEIIADQDPSRVTLEYERVEPKFLTLLGSATPDREKAKSKWRYKISKTLSMNLGFLWYRDDLNGQKAYRTDNLRPEFGFTIKRLLNRQYSYTDISYRYDRSYGGGINSQNQYININYRDRFGLFDSDSNFGFNVFKTASSIRNNDEYTYNTSLSSRHTLGKIILKPTLYLGGWTSYDELADSQNQIYEESLGLGIEIPKMKITANIKGGRNRLLNETGDDSIKTFGAVNIYYKPTFLQKLNNGMLFLKAFINDFDYSQNSRSFRETSVTTGLNIEF